MKKRLWIAICTVAVMTASPAIVAPVDAYAAEPTVQYGNQSSVVKSLQEDLHKLGYFNGPDTGYFGSETLAAVKSFQKAQKLTTDGIVGSHTWSAIDSAMAASKSSSTSTSGDSSDKSSDTSSGTSSGQSSGKTSSQSSGQSSNQSGDSTSNQKSSNGNSPSDYGLAEKSIIVDGKSVTSIWSLVHGGTTYMPVDSMIQMLGDLHLVSKWSNENWDITIPSTYKIDMTHIHLPNGSATISINGTTVMRVPPVSNRDPNNLSAMTDYLPIYDVQLVLARAGFQSKWNGKAWSITTPAGVEAPPPTTSPATDGLTSKSIVLNGKPLSPIMSMVHGGTTYMPVNSMIQMLTNLNIQGKWSGGVWSMTLPSYDPIDVSNIKLQNGTSTITLNGTTVMRATSITYRDPNNVNATTDYWPIYDVQLALARAGVQSKWDGKTWTLTAKLTGYTTYDKTGKQLSSYPTEAAAQSAIANLPGATVHDPTGAVVYTEPDFEAFAGPGDPAQDFISLTAATQAVSSDANGYVVDALKNTVVQQPSNYYYLNSAGSWTSSAYGWQGTVSPTFAQPGAVYLVSDTGNSPYLNQFFLLSQNGQYVGKSVGVFEDPFRTVDLRFPSPATVTGSQIDSWLGENNSPLQGLGSAMVMAQNTYGTNATYLLAHAIEETGWGRSQIAQQKNNLYGYGAYDSNPGPDAGVFPSNEYAVIFQAWEVRNNYLNPGSSHFYNSPTLDGMNEYYATGHTWSTTIAALMSQFVAQTDGSIGSYMQYTPANAVAAPSSTQEPVYQMNGATGTILQNPYTNLPVYPGPTVGGTFIFPGPLSSGSVGPAVMQLQQALNQNGANPVLTVDGGYGPLTQAAVAAYQTAHHLPVTGVCTLDVWTSLFPTSGQSGGVPTLPVGTPVMIDEMEQGMDGNFVTEWYHIRAGSVSGWVDSSYVQLTNVYRAMATSGSSIPVYGAEATAETPIMTLHSGDFVVAANPKPDANGFIQVQLVNQMSGATYTNQGQPVTGYISANTAQLATLSASSGTS